MRKIGIALETDNICRIVTQKFVNDGCNYMGLARYRLGGHGDVTVASTTDAYFLQRNILFIRGYKRDYDFKSGYFRRHSLIALAKFTDCTVGELLIDSWDFLGEDGQNNVNSTN